VTAADYDKNATGASVDGRNARRDRNRELVLDAALELFGEGELEPNALDVAERSGVSERSVFRYFEDREALLRAAIARHLERTLPLYELPGLGEGGLASRIDRLVTHRLALYGALAATVRVALRRAPTNDIIAAQLARARRRLREQFEAMFAPELRAMPAAERRSVVAAADALLQFESVEHLFAHLALTEAHVRDALRHALTSMIETPRRPAPRG
jgi:AcrR family transcriptional regulator